MSTVLLLGATSDMAVAIARKMAGNGNNIQLAARNSNRLQALQSDISVRYNVNCTIHDNVHVLTVLPGFVNTKMTAELKLPPLLTASPEQVADAVEIAIRKKKNVIYVKWFWKWIMKIIKNIPEGMFKKKKL